MNKNELIPLVLVQAVIIKCKRMVQTLVMQNHNSAHGPKYVAINDLICNAY